MTSVVQVLADILQAVDEGYAAVLALLDLCLRPSKPSITAYCCFIYSHHMVSMLSMDLHFYSLESIYLRLYVEDLSNYSCIIIWHYSRVCSRTNPNNLLPSKYLATV